MIYIDDAIVLFVLFVPIFPIIFFIIYEEIYYESDRFLKIKRKINKHINECNELNEHIEGLKNTYVNFKQTDYGHAVTMDNSFYNYQRKELEKYRNSEYIYNCSLTVCRNAQNQPFKYLCKYFNIKADESTLSSFEEVLNNFSAVEQGKILLDNQKKEILNNLWREVPFLIKTFSKKKFERRLGFQKIDFSNIYFPKFIFSYISSGGNSSMYTEITLDIENLNKFIIYLSEIIKFKKSIIGQRTLMTSKLREKIKKRDNYTCQICGNSVFKEKNLLLEIDHIKPLSKGGITSEENLQTLCWKCNRTKGTKYEENVN